MGVLRALITLSFCDLYKTERSDVYWKSKEAAVKEPAYSTISPGRIDVHYGSNQVY